MLSKFRGWLHERLQFDQIRAKLGIAFVLMFISLAIIGIFVLSNNWTINDAFAQLRTTQARLSELANDIRYYDVALTDAVRAYLLDPEDQAAYDRYFVDGAALDAALDEAQALATSAEDRELFANIDRVNIALVAYEEQLLADPDIATAVELYRGEYGALKAEYAAYVQTFVERQQQAVKASEALVYARLIQSRMLFLVLALIWFGILNLVSYYMRGGVKALMHLDSVTRQFAAGDMSARVPIKRKDELGMLATTFNEMADHQQEYVKSLDLARREAEEATRMKDLFLATMSHELRTPLNAMIGFLYLMIYSGQLDKDNQYMAERAQANTQRLLTLINNILDLSRIATGGMEIVPEKMSPRHIAAGLYNDLKLLAQEKDLTLELEVDPNLPDSILQDEARVSQIVTNLVGNAIKFTDKGTVTLTLKRRDDRFVIQVKDTGAGIPQSKQHLIFDDFFQVDSTSTRQKQGAGLGLAIVKRLLLLMGGTINVASEVGVGSTFTVELPLNLPPYEQRDRRKQAEHVFTASMNGQGMQPTSAALN